MAARRVLGGAVIGALAASLLVGCGGGGKAAGGGGDAPQTKRTKLPPGPAVAWDTMTFEQRKKYMKDKVLPWMKPIFTAYDPDFFADFSCATCHGADAVERGFEMPNPDILNLYPTGSAEQKKLVEEEREWLVFMINEVVPNVQALLGVPEWDAATQTGFTCFYCHPKGVSAGAPAVEAPGEPSGADRGPATLDAAEEAHVRRWLASAQ